MARSCWRAIDPALELARDPVKVLDVSNHCFIDLTYKGFVHFRDSCRQLPDRLAKLGTSFGVETMKGCQCHKRYNDPSALFADRCERYKPSRTLYVTDAPAGDKLANPLKHEKKTLLDKESYRAIPGKDPDGDLDGPGASSLSHDWSRNPGRGGNVVPGPRQPAAACHRNSSRATMAAIA